MTLSSTRINLCLLLVLLYVIGGLFHETYINRYVDIVLSLDNS